MNVTWPQTFWCKLLKNNAGLHTVSGEQEQHCCRYYQAMPPVLPVLLHAGQQTGCGSNELIKCRRFIFQSRGFRTKDGSRCSPPSSGGLNTEHTSVLASQAGWLYGCHDTLYLLLSVQRHDGHASTSDCFCSMETSSTSMVQGNVAGSQGSELRTAMDSLRQKLQKSSQTLAGVPAQQDCSPQHKPQPKPVATSKAFDPLGRNRQRDGVAKPLQAPPPIRAPPPQPMYDQPISPPRPVNLNNSPLKRRGPALSRGGPLPNAFLPSSFSRQNPLGSRHGSGLASASGSGSGLLPAAAAGTATAAPALQETR